MIAADFWALWPKWWEALITFPAKVWGQLAAPGFAASAEWMERHA